MFSGPFTFNALPILTVYSIIVSMISLFSRHGGTHIIASPEWIPALSMCSIIEPITISLVPPMASTSTSDASSKNLLITIG